MKRTYSSPTLFTHGSVANITRGNQTGESLDMTFPEGTPGEDLTFTSGTGDFCDNVNDPPQCETP